MRDYVYAAWAKQIAVPLQKASGGGGHQGAFASLCRMPTCTTYLSSDGATLVPPRPQPASPLFMEVTRRVRSPRVSSIAPTPPTAHNPLGHASDCFRIIAHWFKQFPRRRQRIIHNLQLRNIHLFSNFW